MRKSKIVGFSLPPEVETSLNDYALKSHKTRSELLREMIDYFISSKAQTAAKSPSPSTALDTAGLLNLAASSQLEFVGLAIIRHPQRKQILICQRQSPDEYVPGLRWAFPGCRLSDIRMAAQLEKALGQRLGLQPEAIRPISARLIPNSLTPLAAIYFEVKVASSSLVLDKSKYRSSKWVAPEEVYSYFSTSVSDEITAYLSQLARQTGGANKLIAVSSDPSA